MRQLDDLLNAVKELSETFDECAKAWPQGELNRDFKLRVRLAQAVGKVNGLAFMLREELRVTSAKTISDYRLKEHLYGSENAQG